MKTLPKWIRIFFKTVNCVAAILALILSLFLLIHTIKPFKYTHEQIIEKVQKSSDINGLRNCAIADDNRIRLLERIINRYYYMSVIILILVLCTSGTNLVLLFFYNRRNKHSEQSSKISETSLR